MVAGNKKVRSFRQSGENGKGDGYASLGLGNASIAERCGGSQGEGCGGEGIDVYYPGEVGGKEAVIFP